MIHLAYALAEDLESYVETSGECEVERVTVTAGEPAASACNAIWVWASRIEDDNFLNPACVVESLLTVNYRIDVCYQTTAEEETDLMHADAAECLYSLMAAIWCGLVADKDANTLMGLGSCDLVNLAPLIVGQRSGSTVSASGSVIVGYDC